MITSLKTLFDSGHSFSACWCSLRDPMLVEHVAKQGFDALVIDGQHGFHDEVSMLECVSAVVHAKKSPLVRVPVGRWDLVQRVLDFGALGVIAPMINTREDALAFVDAAKYPTTGSRSYGPHRAIALHGLPDAAAYLEEADRSTFTLAQIETRQAYDNLDDILAVDGLDGVLMGPMDFAIFMTETLNPVPYGPETIDAITDIAKRTRDVGKVTAAFTTNAEHSKLVKSLGYQMVVLGIETHMMAAGAKAFLSAADI